MTGKEIVDAFCFYQRYGTWTLKEKELILAIDDNNARYEEEITGLKMLLSQAENAAGLQEQRAREAEQKCKDIEKGYLKLGLY